MLKKFFLLVFLFFENLFISREDIEAKYHVYRNGHNSKRKTTKQGENLIKSMSTSPYRQNVLKRGLNNRQANKQT